MSGENNAKMIRQLDFKTGEEIEVYESISAAARDNFINITSLQKALWRNNGVMAVKKLRFEYALKKVVEE